jgi:hypothetical protein
MAQKRSANCLEQCPLSGVTQTTFAHTEFFLVLTHTDSKRKRVTLRSHWVPNYAHRPSPAICSHDDIDEEPKYAAET